MRGAIPNHQTRPYDATPIHVPQNVGPASPRLFVVVESPWYTAEQMGGVAGTDYGIYVAAVLLPIVDTDLRQKVDIPTGMLTEGLFGECFVTQRGADGFPTEATVSYDTGTRDAAVTKLYCGSQIGRPFRSQIVSAIPADGKWWLTGDWNASLIGTYVDATSMRIGLPSGGGLTVDPCMPPADPEYDENSIMPATKFSSSLDMGFAVDDVVVAAWIGNAYYMLPLNCSELV